MMCEGLFSDACLLLLAGEDRGYSAARNHCFSKEGRVVSIHCPSLASCSGREERLPSRKT